MNREKSISAIIGGEVVEDIKSAKETSTVIKENALARLTGGREVQVYLPRGAEASNGDGKETAKLPFHLMVPMRTAAGRPWGVPQAKRVDQIDDSGSNENGRPFGLVTMQQQIPGNNTYSSLWLALGLWDPRIIGPAQVLKGEETMLVDLTKRHQVMGGIEIGVDGEAIDAHSHNLTADMLIKAMKKFFTDQGISYHAMPSDTLLSQAIELVCRYNPGWRTYWERAQARQLAGAHLVQDQSGHAFAAALQTFIKAPSGKAHKDNVNSAIREITTAIRGNEVSDWSTFAEVVECTFGKLNTPITLSIGAGSTLAFIENVAGLSAVDQTVVERIVSNAFQLENADSTRYDLAIHGNPTTLLLVDPRIITQMVEGIVNQWVPRMLAIMNASVSAVTAGLNVEHSVQKTHKIAWEAMDQGVESSKRKVQSQAKRAGKSIATGIVDNLPSEISNSMRRTIQGTFQTLEQEANNVPAIETDITSDHRTSN